MKVTGIKTTIGQSTGSSNRGFNIAWQCPNCKYKSNDRIVVVSDFRQYYYCNCDKCCENIEVMNPHYK